MSAIVYTTSATATGGGRNHGHAVSADGALDVTLTLPKAMGGDGAPGTNPEQLFAAGYSACFLGALRFVAGKKKVQLPDNVSVIAEVGFGPREDGTGFRIEPRIFVELPGVGREVAEELAAEAHIVCPYSHALRTATEVAVTVR